MAEDRAGFQSSDDNEKILAALNEQAEEWEVPYEVACRDCPNEVTVYLPAEGNAETGDIPPGTAIVGVPRAGEEATLEIAVEEPGEHTGPNHSLADRAMLAWGGLFEGLVKKDPEWLVPEDALVAVGKFKAAEFELRIFPDHEDRVAEWVGAKRVVPAEQLRESLAWRLDIQAETNTN